VAGGKKARGRKMAISQLGKSMFKCATTWLRPSGSVISPCNNARRDYLQRRWWKANMRSGDLLIRVLEGERGEGGGKGDHEWKGWEVVSLSTHADGYLSRLINDAYVDRLCLLPVCAESVICFFGDRWLANRFYDQFIRGPVRAARSQPVEKVQMLSFFITREPW